MAEAMAQPTACGTWVARLPEMEKNPARLYEYITGNWRPLFGSRTLLMSWHISSTMEMSSRESSSPCWR